MYGYSVVNSSRNGCSLCTSQLQRGLYVLLQKRGLNGHLVGQVSVNDTRHAFKDMPQLQVSVPKLAQVYDTHGHHLDFSVHHFQHTIAHDVRTGVYA